LVLVAREALTVMSEQALAVLGIIGVITLGTTVFAAVGVYRWWRESRKSRREDD
jgi:membrane protein DedA with SNARE-associated domain